MKKASPLKSVFFALAFLTGIYALAFFYGGKHIVLISGTEGSGIEETGIERTGTGNAVVEVENKVCFLGVYDKPCFNVQIADTDKKRAKGLMFVKELPENEGMLFTYDKEGIYSFWMKNTLIPLDVIWIDKDKKIVDIQTAQPCKTKKCPSYTPKGKAQYIVEINAGLSEKRQLSELAYRVVLTQITTKTSKSMIKHNTKEEYKKEGTIIKPQRTYFEKEYKNYSWYDTLADELCRGIGPSCRIQGYYSGTINQREGVRNIYYPNGKRYGYIEYENGKKRTEKRRYLNGKIRDITTSIFSSGSKNRDYVHYYSNGQMASKYSYRNGKKFGFERARYEDGQLKLEVSNHDPKKVISTAYYANGQKSGTTHYDTISSSVWEKHGLSKSRYPNRNLHYETIFNHGKKHGTARLYAEDGTPIYEKQRDNGEPTGIRKKRDEKGILVFEGKYTDRKL